MRVHVRKRDRERGREIAGKSEIEKKIDSRQERDR